MRHSLTVAVVAVLWCASLAPADTIKFRSGKTIRCDVLKYDDGVLTIRDDAGKVMTGKMSGILWIDFDKGERRDSDESATPRGGGARATTNGVRIGAVQLPDSDWTVVQAEDLGRRLKPSNQFVESKTTTGRFIRVRFRITNRTNTEARIMDTPRVVDSKEREFREIDEAIFFLPKGAKAMALEAIPATMEREFWGIYEVAPDSKGLKFQARSLSMFGKKALIDLGL